MSYFLGPLKLISVPSSNSYMVKIGNEVVAPLKLKFYLLMINSANVRKTLHKKKYVPLLKVVSATFLLVCFFLSFQRISCNKESEEVSMLIWTNFDSLAIIYLI